MTISNIRTLTSFVLLGSSLLFAGCLKKDDTDTDADSPADAVDSSDSTQAEGNMMMSSVDSSDMTSVTAITAAQIAANIAINIPTRFLPAGCATATVTGTNVAVVYSDCTGPRGLVHVTGDLALAVSISTAGSITVAGTATGLEVNGATLDVDATGTYSSSGTTHTLAVVTNGSGTGPRGTTVDHDGNYTINWDPTTTCGSIDGTWSTEIGAADRSNTVDLSSCAGACPTGTLTHNYLAGLSLTLTFDGTATAEWSVSTGLTGTVALSCTPAS